MKSLVFAVSLALILAGFSALGVLVNPQDAVAGFCGRSSTAIFSSCKKEVRSNYWLARGRCLNLPSLSERQVCLEEAREERTDGLEECRDRFDLRLEICRELGGKRYNPVIEPENFTASVDNLYFPLIPGSTLVYEGDTPEGLEQIVVTVTGETREVMGVTCVVVRDTVTVGGELVEDTKDWYAQDVEGNVWYFGEESREYEDGNLVSLEGSWEAGVDGAQPGIIMMADPQVGDLYRQEYFLGEAEDMGEVLGLSESVTVSYGTYDNCLKIKDYSTLEPDVVEHKYYAPGVGVVLEEQVEGGTDRVELVDIQ